ncbi:MAG: hypothetical protein H7Y32_17615 [Chloroflexales bacterium]|nr:hypothetical protein [Chloroflexales bacterium]
MADERPTAEQPDGRGWLRRVLARFVAQPRRGDVIAANVAGSAQGVAVGKNIVQIGTLNVPVWPLFALLLVLAVGAGVWALAQRGPPVMQGQFNVAVADFVELDVQGRARTTERAERLGALVFDTLRASYPQPNPALLIWRDGSVPWTQQGARIGTVAGGAQAITTARQISADVLIYGALDGQARFTLQLYVSQRSGIYGDANAIVGAYRFGEPIQLDAADIAASSDALTSRVHALVGLIKGMRADRRGDFNAAQAAYADAERQLPVGKSRVKAIIGFFKGNSFYYRSLLDSTAPAESQALLNEARDAFTEALRNDNSYARAHIGLGSVYYERAQRWENHAERLQQPELEMAIAAFGRASTLALSTSEPALVLAIAQQGLATAYYLKGATLYNLGREGAADPVLNGAVTLLVSTRVILEANGEYRLVAQSYQTLGGMLRFRARIAQRRNDRAASQELYAQADAAYAGCVEQGGAAANDAALSVLTSSCAETRQQLQPTLMPPA